MVGEQRLERGPGIGEVVRGLEERHDVERVVDPVKFSQTEHLDHIRRALGHRDDVRADRVCAEPGLERPNGAEQLQQADRQGTERPAARLG